MGNRRPAVQVVNLGTPGAAAPRSVAPASAQSPSKPLRTSLRPHHADHSGTAHESGWCSAAPSPPISTMTNCWMTTHSRRYVGDRRAGSRWERSIVSEVRGARLVRTPAETSPTIRALRSPGELLCCTWWTRLSDCRRALWGGRTAAVWRLASALTVSQDEQTRAPVTGVRGHRAAVVWTGMLLSSVRQIGRREAPVE